jgi:glycine/D-amino acid oxidase-like deaminating enzyme
LSGARPKVLVIGAGIIGASIAWHLARLNARVSVVDAAEPGGIATRNSWAWINASWGHPEPYFRLRVCAMEEWRRLERELADIRVAWTGSLNWELPAGRLEAFAARHAAWGYDIRCVGGAEARRIEPSLADPPVLAVHAPREGAMSRWLSPSVSWRPHERSARLSSLAQRCDLSTFEPAGSSASTRLVVASTPMRSSSRPVPARPHSPTLSASPCRSLRRPPCW